MHAWEWAEDAEKGWLKFQVLSTPALYVLSWDDPSTTPRYDNSPRRRTHYTFLCILEPQFKEVQKGLRVHTQRALKLCVQATVIYHCCICLSVLTWFDSSVQRHEHVHTHTRVHTYSGKEKWIRADLPRNPVICFLTRLCSSAGMLIQPRAP